MLNLEDGVCASCGEKHINMKSIRVSQDRGFISSSQSVDVCESCISDMYINDYGFEFIMIDHELHMRHPINGCYELITSQRQIDDAFNPDYAAFTNWIKRK